MSDPTRAVLYNFTAGSIDCFGAELVNINTISAASAIESASSAISSNGSASAPVIYRTSDSNTGIYWVAADTLGFTAGGTLRASISERGVIATGLSTAFATKTATYTVTVNDHTLLGDATAGAMDFDLPDATTCGGQIFYFKKIDGSANIVTVDPNGSQTIDGSASWQIAATDDAIAIQSDGANWRVIAHFVA